jgi:hypothetical protein
MTTLTSFIMRHPVGAYFALALTFAISWGGFLVSSVLAASQAPAGKPTHGSRSRSWRC